MRQTRSPLWNRATTVVHNSWIMTKLKLKPPSSFLCDKRFGRLRNRSINTTDFLDNKIIHNDKTKNGPKSHDSLLVNKLLLLESLEHGLAELHRHTPVILQPRSIVSTVHDYNHFRPKKKLILIIDTRRTNKASRIYVLLARNRQKITTQNQDFFLYLHTHHTSWQIKPPKFTLVQCGYDLL